MPINLRVASRVSDLLFPELPQRLPYVPIWLRRRGGFRGGVPSDGTGLAPPTIAEAEGLGLGGGGVPGGDIPSPGLPPPGGGGGVITHREWNRDWPYRLMEGVDLARLPIYPVNLYGFTPISDVNGAEIGPIAGPFVVRWLRFVTSGTFTGNDHDANLRVDFSGVPGRDTFTHSASAVASGVSSAPYTLFQYVADFAGSGAGSDISKSGWFNIRSIAASSDIRITDLAVPIPLGAAWIKVYLQSDSGTAAGWNMSLGISPLGSPITWAIGGPIAGAETV